jgi:hypothetical protein
VSVSLDKQGHPQRPTYQRKHTKTLSCTYLHKLPYKIISLQDPQSPTKSKVLPIWASMANSSSVAQIPVVAAGTLSCVLVLLQQQPVLCKNILHWNPEFFFPPPSSSSSFFPLLLFSVSLSFLCSSVEGVPSRLF